MAQDNNHILIIGGGTAGWLSAAILAKSLNSQSKDGVKLTLVESPDVPIIGVGEGTWPNLRGTLQRIGVSETDFIRECDVTFKQGAEFVNWSHTPTPQQPHSYYHPLSTVNHSSYNFSLAPYWLQQDVATRLPYDRAVATQARLCDHGLAPKQIVMPEYSAVQEYAYHLNANKFADFLKRHCIEKLGVNFVSANVTEVVLDHDEFISHVTTDSAEQPHLEADFFIDCSGNRGLIIKQTYNIDWQDISDVIFNDTALAVQVPYPNDDREIKTHTIATAQDAGWIWDIGLRNRRGVGHVFSSKYTTEAKAKQQLIDYIGTDYSDDLMIRTIKLNHGYHKKFWHKNSVAIGMSAGFVEPLEASAIFLFDAAANMIAAQFPRDKAQMPYVEQKFNQHFTMRMERTVEFIKLHYCISQRRDSQYWIDNCDDKSIPDNLKQRLSYWKSLPPTKYDFDNAWEPFNLDSYLYVLYGMGFETDAANVATKYTEKDAAQAMFNDINKASDLLIDKLPKQKELVDKVLQYGFAKV
ncbi:tryptophan halogenase family protein [Psychrobium sp. 1_MG-2023]|uniref:tryptophan halogenase family protein n=1 Tax=Psychrobium sp. 1_MG-2023 TaxID=3062624 RepID=UPI000C33B61C|nr:tryptophan halogenase family protein [Psychrobium sp. 1_MG-2023]MDP2559882.1 tryptophan 7-halogenase [Psychrobium sp. 1_MG-2023]PKF59017.1 tryptophan 7-halogenase [Alteromonadales bacterium alter-6D02]